ncbi:NADH dehydrogenase (ubiquinone) Fe-S protein 4 [Entomortierella parvispora]|uniref:NADH dehydrogenase [ubiquinone] iron-sulfur protein 4, mitochondrial n=1 Tax=Entomortierella parvispora TaxID=205924 RepID=A0A9P3LWJ9_9FUNG|nr:NADH dehydrogenase (ubiquinone) Fe-S protein 4 [Entomortierella parvispora]
MSLLLAKQVLRGSVIAKSLRPVPSVLLRYKHSDPTSTPNSNPTSTLNSNSASAPNSNSSSTPNSTSVTETHGHTALQAEIISGAPEEVRLHPCRIYKQSRSATQSGIVNTGVWRVDFDTELNAGQFENELIGWASSSDYMHGLQVKFNTKEEAIAFADKQGWDFTVEEPNQKIFKKKVYADSFKYSPTKLRFVSTK